ncbi:senescence/dehydration-associated protein At4g35985, chloroplastic-like [Triticum dicoccoides]|uniref:senescence/dehydration-associated protein At4g35985, chloroplastic-like n=1 Tax=Triticum dicoccoides TaxID=85692 RepID=UPI000E795B26|nr:senescence/dehydration-associated protein At4g35985, chloroplastic-like [Triticum dicoccoides]
MGCCGGGAMSSSSSSRPRGGIREETLLRVPGAAVHLVAGSEGPLELGRGELSVVRIFKDDVAVTTVVRVGRDLGWPLARDEPVVKLDRLHYLFTLPDKDGGLLNYGVSFADAALLPSFDALLKSNSCFSTPSAPSRGSRPPPPASASPDAYWNDFSPKVESYNNVLAKAIGAGTGHLVKGIFMCSEAYASQVQKGANLINPQAAGGASKRFGGTGGADGSSQAGPAKRGGVNKSLKRVRKLSEMTEKMSKTMLDTVISVAGSMAAPLLRSNQGKALLSTVPGEVVIASLDAINKVMDAVEAAERRSLAATSNVVSGAVSKRYGESAGEATGDAFATVGHTVGTAWNIFKIRKAVTPSSSLPGNMVKSAVRNRN